MYLKRLVFMCEILTWMIEQYDEQVAALLPCSSRKDDLLKEIEAAKDLLICCKETIEQIICLGGEK